MVPHIDGQLCVNENSSHVTAALQALLHCESLMMVIREDTEHRKSCSTLFKCMICSLAKLCANFKSCGIANPKTLITRWNVASALMDDASKENPFEVLKVFIDLLCLEYAQRNPMFTIVDLRESVVSQIWHNVFTLDVSCEFCGQYEIKNYKSFIDLSKEPVTNLEVSLSNQFLAETESRCMKCLHMSGCTPVDICFSDCLIVHVQRCSSEFVLNFHMEVLGVKWSFKSVIVKQFKPAHPPFTIASCPDKYFRRFDDTKVTKVSPVGLSVADFLYQSSLTFIYEKTKQQPAAEKQGSSNKQLKICQTELSQEEVCSGGLSRKDASTQTSVNTVGVGVQTLRYYCYETCKQREKFKFFTGLETEEFQALFKLIGGDEVIGRLKRKYSLNSPQKIQPQKLSSEDKLFMFLLRLRRGIPLEELSEAFQMSISSVGEICYMMTRVIYLTLKGIEEKCSQVLGSSESTNPYDEAFQESSYYT